MQHERDSWVTLLVAGLALLVVGLLVLETVAWYVRYAALGASLLLTLLAIGRARRAQPSA